MTTRTRLLLPLLLAAVALPATAQRDDPDATVKALAYIIKTQPAGKALDKVVADICSSFNKNANVYAGAARAWWYNAGDSARAFRYIDRAIGINPKCVPAYTLKGDIYAWCKDTTTAVSWFDKAIKADPQNPKGYESLAGIRVNSDPDGAVALLQKVKDSHPAYPFHLKAARIYERLLSAGKDIGENMEKAIQHYEQVDRDSMESSDVIDYASHYRGMHQYDKCMEIAKPYKERFASDPYFNRMCLYTCVDGEKYHDSDEYAERLMTAADTIINSTDYRYYVRSKMGQHKYDAAIGMCRTWMAKDQTGDADKQYAIGKMAEAYKELGEYDKAEHVYADYIASREKSGSLSAYDVNSLAKMYVDKAEELNGQEKIDAWMKADSMYNILATKFVQYADMAYYQRYRITLQMYPDPKDGKALQIAQNLISVILAKSERNDTDNARLAEMYRYIAFCYLQNDNFRKSKFYWQKLLEVAPDDAGAKKALNVLKKY